MKPALPTAPVTYGLNGPSATATVDNATPAGLHLSQRKFCPNKWDRLSLHSKDARKIASFDVWTDLKDRNYGNVIRSPNGGYVSIDHETILHDLLWPQTGRIFHPRSLLVEARQHMSPKDFQRFQVDMANAAQKHAQGLVAVRADLADIITKIYPRLSAKLIPAALNTLDQRAQAGWLAHTLGVIA